MSVQNCGPLISVIVPVFQTEKYLEKCILSILNQTYQNMEIILVDDGSTDNCSVICDKYQTEDARVKVIHKENGGLSQARNIGLKLARGDFVGFVDSDDWIEPNMYEVLISVLQGTGADIAVCHYRVETDDSKSVQINGESFKIKLYSSEEALRMLINGEGFIDNFVWNKLYIRSILYNIYFPEGKIYEDVVWTPKTIHNAGLLVCIDRPLYHYLYRSDSLSHNKQNIVKGVHDKIEMSEQRIKFIQENHPTLKKKVIWQFQDLCCKLYIKISLNAHQLDKDGIIRHDLYRHFRQFGINTIYDIDNLQMTFTRMMFWLFPSLCSKTYIFYKKCME